MDSKTCRDCGAEKPLEEFHRAGKYPDGRSIYCKPCANLRRRTNKERELAPDYVPQRVHVKIEDGRKRCSRCHERKPLADFVISNGRGALHGYCKPCHAAWAREHKKKPGVKARAAALRKARQFGITVSQYEGMVEAQQGLCAICKGPGGVHGLCVDHDHETGVVRQLLCSSCNAGIAMLKHDAERIRAAADYVERWGAVIASTGVPATSPPSEGALATKN